MRGLVFAVLLLAIATPWSTAQPGAPMSFINIGAPQAVPSPPGTGGLVGSADMAGLWFNQLGQRLLSLRLRYISPTGYVTYPNETVFLGYNGGSSSVPGVTSLGAQIYLPLTPPVSFVSLGGVTWNGPGDTVPPTSSGGTGAACPFPPTEACNFGKRYDLTVSAQLSGVPITAQFFLYDAAINRLYSSNALNMVAP